MADILGAIVIAAGTVVAAYINAAANRSPRKGVTPRRPAKPKKRKSVPAATSRVRRRPS